MSDIKKIDYGVAELLSAGSSLVQIVPPLQPLFMPKGAPYLALTNWRHARMPSSDIKNWLEFDRASGRLPSTYGLAAIIGIEREVVDNHARKFGGRLSVAYKLGSAITFGESEKKDMYGIDLLDSAYYKVAMGIGKGVLQALPVIVHDERELAFLPRATMKSEVVAKPNVSPWIPMH